MLYAENVSVHFGGLKAVDNVSMHISPGEIHAIIGPNGAGKSTFFNAISGINKPTSGTIRFLEKDITGLSQYQVARAGVGRTFQNIKLFNTMTVEENVLCGYHQNVRSRMIQDMIGTRFQRQEEKDLRDRCHALLERVELYDKRGMNAYEGRMVAMFIFACFPLLALGAQPLGVFGSSLAVNAQKFLAAMGVAILIGLACAGHQAWSANVYSVVGDMFPKSTIGTLTGIAQFAAGCGSFMVNKCAGKLFTYAAEQGDAFAFCGYTGKPAGYMILFSYCAVAYIVGWCFMKGLVPHYKKVEL